ncbi:hypothetical protein KEJ47_09390 [Candidatus Bathyarchaeota archaeon]|nr:hypothetical protein [Candidatus Bathyarchaeota archaeon]
MTSNAQIPDNIFIEDAKRIVAEGEKRKIVIRILGALAIRLHTYELSNLHQKLDRLGDHGQQFTDLDFIAYGKHRNELYKMFKDLNYELDKRVAAYFGHIRGIWYHPQSFYHVDVFYDSLSFSHTIFFGSKPGQGRLELDYPTITLADILLEKTQIHDIGEKDIKDVIILLHGHNVGEVEQETININRICEVLKNDWGFYYDFKINMGKIVEFAEKYKGEKKITSSELDDIKLKVEKILDRVEAEPKTKGWMKRSKVGTNKQWWITVEEVER